MDAWVLFASMLNTVSYVTVGRISQAAKLQLPHRHFNPFWNTLGVISSRSLQLIWNIDYLHIELFDIYIYIIVIH